MREKEVEREQGKGERERVIVPYMHCQNNPASQVFQVSPFCYCY